MKQKFNLHIADLEISVITTAPPDEVERIRGILDRRMRETYLRSRCSKTQAALLCALDAIAERLDQQAEFAELEARCEKYAVVLENLQAIGDANAAEIDRLRQENEVLRSLISTGAGAPVAPDPIPPTEFFSEVADAQTTGRTPEVEEADEVPAPVAAAEIPANPPVSETNAAAQSESSPRSRSRVGSMFDLLSFDEVD